MNKKHISIIGSCVSRQMFNDIILQNIFDIDKYIYQVCFWDLFGNKIDIDKNSLLSFYKEEFTTRMIICDLTKNVLAELETAKSEYLLIDLYNIIENISEFKIDNKSIYAQVSYDRYSSFFNNLKSIKNGELLDLKHSSYSYKKVDENLILSGLELLANWINKHYDGKNVIVNVPSFAEKYITLNQEIMSYSERIIENGKNNLNAIKKYSKFLSSKIPNSKILDLTNINCISQFNVFDDINKFKIPPQIHYTTSFYLKMAKKFLQLLNLNLKEFISFPDYLSPIDFECARFKNLYLTELKTKSKSVVYQSYLNLNEYISKIENIDDFLILISVKDEASLYLKNFKLKDKLKLKMDIGYRQSYIAVIDFHRNFIKEISSNELINFDYNIPSLNSSIIIRSGGYNSGNISSILLNTQTSKIELSENKRGLNFALLNTKTLKIIDTFRCDSNGDSSLQINSKYFLNQNIKI